MRLTWVIMHFRGNAMRLIWVIMVAIALPSGMALTPTRYVAWRCHAGDDGAWTCVMDLTRQTPLLTHHDNALTRCRGTTVRTIPSLWNPTRGPGHGETVSVLAMHCLRQTPLIAMNRIAHHVTANAWVIHNTAVAR